MINRMTGKIGSLMEVATDGLGRSVQGHVVRSSIVVAPGRRTVGPPGPPRASPNAAGIAPAHTEDPALSGSVSIPPSSPADVDNQQEEDLRIVNKTNCTKYENC
jgi:hypothetical protein